jgi:hypothetical protein
MSLHFTRVWLLVAVLALFSLASATNLRLPQVQSIVGFSSSCFNAYNTLLPDCSLADFLGSVGGRSGGCSVSCVSQLQTLQPIVQASCQGERAGRDTVIGQMFIGSVTSFLCGNNVGGEASSTTTTTAETSLSTASTTMSAAAPAESTSASTTTSASSTTTTEASTTVTSDLTSLTETTSSTTTAAQATQSNNADQGGEDGTATTFGGAGGGSPFDGGPGEFDGAAATLSMTRSLILVMLAVEWGLWFI